MARSFPICALLLVVAGSAKLACPDATNMALVDGEFCVDLFEGAVEEVTPSGVVPWPHYAVLLANASYRAVVARGMPPQGYISEVQAAAACGASGKRLCSIVEWMMACQGPENYTYPYGNTYIPGACNEGRPTNPVNDCFGYGPPNPFTFFNMNQPCCDEQPHGIADGGAFPRCVSSWGAFDMHGNRHEWISEVTPGGTGVFKGGFFVDAKINGPGCFYATTAHAQVYHDYSTGFRCCASPTEFL